MSIKGFCTFYSNLYIGESIKNPRLVKWKLKHGAGQLFIYVITAPEMAGGQLEIKHCAVLKQKYYKRHPAFVYGIAGSYKEAVDIIVKLCDEANENGLTGDIKGYLGGALGDN
ncbi:MULTISPECIES: hypothetical protein [unclassified Butyrivibrio]|uniref:hypothetical protein n=1 Tax=unclassified Butyrivibrio TaxID=2639466 RepID=UPI00041D7D27|nr:MULTISPECIES: hypothetical protein [unclassified Butyrivibrio]